MFRVETAGQMAAWFLHRQGGRMPHLKLMKLLYMAERTSIQKNGYPILGDKLVSMDHGPVLSVTLNYMQGGERPGNGWDKWVSPKENHEVSLTRRYNAEDLDLLSEAVLKILEEVWRKFGHMGQWEIRDYTHEHCPEWKDPHGSSNPITYETLLAALGYGEKEAAETALEFRAQREIAKALST